jgi:uncharacterized membrane protein YjfL (UPF0719 family)
MYDLAAVGEAAVLVVAALFASLWINDKFILSEFSNTKEVVEKRNIAVAIVEASTLTATALIFSGAFGGSDDKFSVELGWFALGQVLLIGLAFLYRRAMIKDANVHLQSQNTAVAMSMGGLLIALGMALGNAVSGPTTTVGVELMNIGLVMVAWLVFMGGLRLLVNYAIIPGARMRKEIVEDKNWGIGLVDGAMSIALTAVFNVLVIG